jgi:palmitoyltransferase ZDHHC13/17
MLYVRLVLNYLAILPAPSDDVINSCRILTPALCTTVLRDPWTVALAFWTVLQLVWVTMLIVVQTIQISKNQTTYENMKRHDKTHDHGNRPILPIHNHPHPHPITQGASTATTSLNDSAAASTRLQPTPRRPDSFLTRWKKMLGLDVFLVTASDASQGHLQSRNSNPFSRGIIGNCKDFWCDPAPVFGKRRNGEGFLEGEVVDYARLYDVPLRLRGPRAGGMRYESVAGEEEGL